MSGRGYRGQCLVADSGVSPSPINRSTFTPSTGSNNPFADRTDVRCRSPAHPWLPHVQPCAHPSAALARKSAGMIEMFMRIQKIADIFRVEAKIADIPSDFRGGLRDCAIDQKWPLGVVIKVKRCRTCRPYRHCHRCAQEAPVRPSHPYQRRLCDRFEFHRRLLRSLLHRCATGEERGCERGRQQGCA